MGEFPGGNHRIAQHPGVRPGGNLPVRPVFRVREVNAEARRQMASRGKAAHGDPIRPDAILLRPGADQPDRPGRVPQGLILQGNVRQRIHRIGQHEGVHAEVKKLPGDDRPLPRGHKGVGAAGNYQHAGSCLVGFFMDIRRQLRNESASPGIAVFSFFPDREAGCFHLCPILSGKFVIQHTDPGQICQPCKKIVWRFFPFQPLAGWRHFR